VRKLVVGEGAPDEDARGADTGVEARPAFAHGHVETCFGEQASGVEPGQPGADDEYVHGVHA
jgi:hypothetical protein